MIFITHIQKGYNEYYDFMSMGITEKNAIIYGVGITCFVILILFAIFVVPIPMKEFVEKSGLNTIEKIDFSGNNLYSAIGGSLFNFDRQNYVLVGDQLWYSTLFQSKLDYPIELHAYFQVFVGGKNSTNLILLEPIPKFTLDDNTNGAHWEYYPTKEGRTKIKANLQFINSSNGVLLHSQNRTTEFDVVSPEYALQDQSNKTTSLALIASGLVGVFTVIVLISSTLYSRNNVKELRTQNKTLVNQNNELKEQHSIQNRPWISIADAERKYELTPNILKIFIKNYGNSPAINMVIRTVSSFSEISLDSQDQWITAVNYYSLAPKEIMSVRPPIANKEYKEAHGGNGIFFGISVEYTYESSKKGKFILIGSIREIQDSGMVYCEKIIE